MVSYKDAGKMLDKAMEALPEGIFEGLNGGVNLIEEAKTDSKGGYVLGLYHNNMMGRYIEIFYGSFRELYGDIPHMQFERRLKSTLHHELTHHIEGLAGDRALEDWDELQEAIWNEPEEAIFVGSILFVDDDDTSLAPVAKALFNMYVAERCPDIPAESAGLFAAGEELQSDCRKAAESYGAVFGDWECKELSEELFEKYEVVSCMTLAQVDELLERFPGSERKVICTDEKDILRPKLKINWKKAVERLHAAINELTLELRLEEERPNPDRIAAEDIELVPLGVDAPGWAVDAIVKLEEENFSTPWTKQMLERAMGEEGKFFLAALCGENLLGYIGGQLLFEELEIFNVAVDSRCRGQGIGLRLAEAMVAIAKEKGAERITLEVRAGNAPAIALYEKLGFAEVGRRKNYYEKPREDAILMDLLLGAEE